MRANDHFVKNTDRLRRIFHPLLVIASPRNEGVAIQLDGLLRRCALNNEHFFVIAREALADRGTPPQMQMDGHVASLSP